MWKHFHHGSASASIAAVPSQPASRIQPAAITGRSIRETTQHDLEVKP